MTVRVVAQPGRPVTTPDGVVDAYASPLMEELRSLYVAKATEFSQRQDDVQKQGPRQPPPTLVLEGDSAESIVIDEDVLSTLLDVYLTEGWAPIAKALVYARARVQGQPEKTSGGTVGDVWVSACEFLEFSVRILWILIRDALTEIEERARARMSGRVATSKKSMDDTVELYAARVTYGTPPEGATRRQPRLVGHIGNSALLATITAALEPIVEVRLKRDAALAEVARLSRALGVVHEHEMERQRSNVLATPDPQTSQSLTDDIQAQSELVTTITDVYNAALTYLAANDRFALLIVDGLPPKAGAAIVGDRLALAMVPLQQALDRLGAALKPDRSLVAEVLPGLPPRPSGRGTALPIDPVALRSLRMTADGPESAVIDFARSALGDDDDVIPLLHEETWRRLVVDGDIARDSFAYVVLHQYLLALDERLARAEKASRDAQAYARTLAQLSAGLSVAVLLTPLAEIAPVMTEVSQGVGAAVLAYQVDSVTSRLRELDAQVSTALVSLDATNEEALAAVGRLMVERSEFVSAMTDTLMQELLFLATGASWPAIKRLLHVRGFLLDVETLFAGDGP